jgi:hypothetical protein
MCSGRLEIGGMTNLMTEGAECQQNWAGDVGFVLDEQQSHDLFYPEAVMGRLELRLTQP